MTSEERLTEIRDLLKDLLEAVRSADRKQDEVRAEYRAASVQYRESIAAHRRLTRFGSVLIVLLFLLLVYLWIR